MTDIEDHDSDKNATVIPILSALPSNGAAQPQRPGKVKNKDIHAMIVDAMVGDRFCRWPEFPVRLHRCVDYAGQSLVYEETDGVVRRVANDRIDGLIATYWGSVSRDRERGAFLGTLAADDVVKTRRLWLARSFGRPTPFPLLTWRSDPRPAFHKVAFDPDPALLESDRGCPLFTELVSRISNAPALCAWIGSLFDERSQRQQYVWMYGGGAVGKGAFVRALKRALGAVARNEDAPRGKPGAFWTMGLLGTRLAIFADCDEPEFVKTGLFKSLTGEDHIRVEIKGGAVMSLELPVKYLFTSNEKPEISSDYCDSRRVIYCRMDGAAERYEGPDYEEALAAELPAFITTCWFHYQAASYGNPRAVLASSNDEELRQVVSEAEHELEAFVDRWLRFERDEAGKLAEDPALKLLYTTCGDMKDAMIKDGFKLPGERKKLRSYLQKRHGVEPTLFRMPGGEVMRGFRGVTLRV